jgi:hypothetical protein
MERECKNLEFGSHLNQAQVSDCHLWHEQRSSHDYPFGTAAGLIHPDISRRFLNVRMHASSTSSIYDTSSLWPQINIVNSPHAWWHAEWHTYPSMIAIDFLCRHSHVDPHRLLTHLKIITPINHGEFMIDLEKRHHLSPFELSVSIMFLFLDWS